MTRNALTAWIVLCLAGGGVPALAAPAKPQPRPTARPTARPKPAVPKAKPSAPAVPKARPTAAPVKSPLPVSRPQPQTAPAVPAALPEPLRRFRIGAFAGVNGTLAGTTLQAMPMASMSVGYLLPVVDDRLEVLFEVGTGGAVQLQATGVGLQYRLADWGGWQPFVGLIGGVTYGLVPPWNGGPALVSPAPMMIGKVGVEWMATPWLGAEAALSAGYPNFGRGQLGAKLAF